MIDRYVAMKPHQISPKMVLWLTRIMLLVVFILVCGLRFIHLGADTPLGVSDNVGLYVDEGYKTLAPRNLILSGSEKISPEDDYQGWFRDSPLTQWAYYAAFRIRGVSLESARIVSIAVFSLFLVGFLLGMKNRLSLLQIILGLLLLGLQSTIFFYSRVALFEIFIVAFLYIPLFFLLRGKMSNMTALVLLGLFGIGSVFLVKASSLIYFLPAFLAGASGSKFKTKKAFGLLVVGTAAVGCLFGVLFWGELIRRMSWAGFILRIFHFPLLGAAPVAVVGGYFCALTGLLFKPDIFAKGIYRRSLLSIVLLSPVFLAFFSYNPLRYYVPILPAYILLILEWLKFKGWERPVSLHMSAGQMLAVWAFSLQTVYQLLQTINLYLLTILPIKIGSDPGISAPTALKLFLPMAFLISGGFLLGGQKILVRKWALSFFSGLLIFFLVFNSPKLWNFLYHPTFTARNVRLAFHHLIQGDALIAGDWAPFLTLGTPYRSLYVNNQFNRKKMTIIRPNYFLFSENKNSYGTLASLLNNPLVILGNPRDLPRYFNKSVRIYPISYKDESVSNP